MMYMNWTKSPRDSIEYQKGAFSFIDHLTLTESYNGKIPCPCRKCKSTRFMVPDEVRGDLLYNGIEKCFIPQEHGSESQQHVACEIDDMDGLLDAVTGQHNTVKDNANSEQVSGDEYMSDIDNEKYDDLFNYGSEKLYPGCEKFTTLSFVIKLLHIKVLSGWSNKSFEMLLALIGEVLPTGHMLPKKFCQCQKIMRDLGLEYTKIDACINDCTLYWKDNASKTHCPTCKHPRWKEIGNTKVAQKSMRYFPLKPRLRRLFISEKTAKDMRWHQDERTNDGLIRHPADSKAWKHFDQMHVDFSSEPRNVRLGLASDGMNPFGNMNINHSTWPVILIPYNLPPWLCMKEHNFILSMVIPGPHAPGNCIDVYLRPLVDELKELWTDDVTAYDACTRKNFRLHAALLWTINDFPAYGNLSGWSTKGKLSCPICNENTTSEFLKHSGKFCFMGHRRSLPNGNRWRSWKKAFNGKPERKSPVKRKSGYEELQQLEHLPSIVFTNKDRHKSTKMVKYLGWTKKSIFFELPYWSTNLLRHNLDVMHIEKNVCEVLLNTLMNIPKKSKDNLKARLDLKKLGIRQKLHPFKSGERYKYPHATFMMDNDQKTRFCNFLMNVKFPDSYASNIARCVKVRDRKLLGLKSHDYHVILQQLLPIAIRDLLPANISEVVTELGDFFRELCSKTLRVENLKKLEEQVVQTLCKLEMIFPPAFFVVMIHLPLHLAEEAILGGTVQQRWMYPVERYLKRLKNLVRNKARPEGSIAEGYVTEECLTFCSRYLHEIETKFNRPERNDDGGQSGDDACLSVFKKNGRAVVGGRSHFLTYLELDQIHHYLLHNCNEVGPYIDEHNGIVERSDVSCRLSRNDNNFATWFKQRVMQDDVSKKLKELAHGPSREAFLYDTYNVNGYRFSTESSQLNRKTQNYGVQVDDGEEIYCGIIQQIVQVPYNGSNWVVLFKCKWFDTETPQGYKFKDGITSVNVKRSTYADQPYVLASQATQVFYVEEIRDANWHAVIKTQPRNYYNMTCDESDVELYDDDEACQADVNHLVHDRPSSVLFAYDEEPQLARSDLPDLTEELVESSK